MVKISTVTYKRLMSVEKFGNISLEATGQLEPGEDRDDAYEEIRKWVDLQLNTRKLAIEGKLSSPDDDEPVPQVWPQVGGTQNAARAQQFPTAQASPATGSSSPVQAGSISAQQVVIGGQVVAQARGGQVATQQVSYPPLTIPPGGRQEVDLDPHGDALLTIYDAQDRMQGQPLTLDGRTATTLIADQGRGRLERTHTGAIAYTPSNFLTEQQPQGGWLQVHEGRGVSPYDTLEYMDWGGRIKRAMAKGWAATALSRGLLVARQGAPGLRFGVSEGAFWAAAPPTPFDDADDGERPEDEAFAADWEEDSADLAGGVTCPDCMGSGCYSDESDSRNCPRCGGSGSIEPQWALPSSRRM